MPIIKPISSCAPNKDIASLCHEQDEPVFLTTNGEGDLVVMSIEHYERLRARVELFGKLAVAQAQAASGEKGFTHTQVMRKLRQRCMANRYALRYLPVAVDDLVSIFDWIARDSPSNAAAFIEKLDHRIGSL